MKEPKDMTNEELKQENARLIKIYNNSRDPWHHQCLNEHFYKLEQSEGKKFPNFSLYNNESDKTRLYLIRHYNGYNKKWLIDASSDSWLKTIVEVS